ncbi:DUF924 domain-containing protein [Candidatus Berkiella cookevillensis]|uniref:DUF924 domain-containing protein n=1 Tax=Candidatus Berkiella cookevillensis TaxID=437022 RepID=A0A0Q9YRN6_9GAMM|nr:DUF924 family protein [Candidatus Berkiella cookevillensis]MCS5707796.1 DUF924 domain-containing protein [Candidatus Berkiella cookevillensis]
MDEILNFWFDYEHEKAPIYNRKIWWVKDQKVDNILREKFGLLREKAIKGELDDCLELPKGTLAYIILIDQFSRNLFRDTPKMFEYDALALSAAKRALKQGLDKTLTLTERVFMYLPLEHSENMNDQNESVALFEQLLNETPEQYKSIAALFLNYARDHRLIIEKFQRFPHRNKTLSRESTSAEIEFLASHPGY